MEKLPKQTYRFNQAEVNVLLSALGNGYGHLLLKSDASLDRDQLRLKRIFEKVSGKLDVTRKEISNEQVKILDTELLIPKELK